MQVSERIRSRHMRQKDGGRAYRECEQHPSRPTKACFVSRLNSCPFRSTNRRHGICTGVHSMRKNIGVSDGQRIGSPRRRSEHSARKVNQQKGSSGDSANHCDQNRTQLNSRLEKRVAQRRRRLLAARLPSGVASQRAVSLCLSRELASNCAQADRGRLSSALSRSKKPRRQEACGTKCILASRPARLGADERRIRLRPRAAVCIYLFPFRGGPA